MTGGSNFMKQCSWIVAIIIALTVTHAATAVTVDEGFEAVPGGNDQYPSAVEPYMSLDIVSDARVHVRDYGANSDVSISTRGGAVFGTGVLDAITTVVTFSMDIGTEINDFGNKTRPDTSGGGAGFGWSRSTDTIDAWSDGSSNATIAVVKTNDGTFDKDSYPGTPDPTFRLAHANNTSQNMGAFTPFGDAEVTLLANHWYRLAGTLEFLGYDAGSGQSSFQANVALYDLGQEGSESTAEPLTTVLTGSTSFSYNGDWSQAQPIFYAKDDRGFNHIDNLSVVPEPTTLALVSLGGLAMLRRRRA